jgi:adenine phosphoribosyltransferase
LFVNGFVFNRCYKNLLKERCMGIERVEAAIRDIQDFPKPGIIFKDITPILRSSELFAEVIDLMCEPYSDNRPDYIVAIESRGFIFGSAMAYKLGCGLVPVRKKGKLPHGTYEASYELEYGTAAVEIHTDALEKGDKVVLLDDLLATGGTAGAAVNLIEKLEANIIGIDFLIELAFLDGRKKLEDYKINTLIVVD